MKRFAAILGLLVAVTAVPAYAAPDEQRCGTHAFDAVADMTKGRTDGMVLEVNHTAGCATYRDRNLVGTGIGESYGYPGQESNCVRYGRDDTVRLFAVHFGMQIDRNTVNVRCSPYQGPD